MEMKLVERNARARVFLLASLRPASGAAQARLQLKGEERRERGCCTRVARAHSQPTLSVPAAAPRRAKSYAQRFGGPVPLGSCTARLPLLLPRLSACLPAAEESACCCCCCCCCCCHFALAPPLLSLSIQRIDQARLRLHLPTQRRPFLSFDSPPTATCILPFLHPIPGHSDTFCPSTSPVIDASAIAALLSPPVTPEAAYGPALHLEPHAQDFDSPALASC